MKMTRNEVEELVAIGGNEPGYREVLAVEAAGGERKEAYRNLLKGLIERGLRGVQLVTSDDHESIKQYEKKFNKAVEGLRRGIEEALVYMRYPTSHHLLIRSTNGLERLFREVKRRTRVVGVFPNETSAVSLSTTMMLRATEDWALRRYMDMEPLKAMYAHPQL